MSTNEPPKPTGAPAPEKAKGAEKPALEKAAATASEVKKNEQSALPDMVDDEPEASEAPQPQPDTEVEPEQEEKIYTPKEIELLKMASAFYQANEEYEAASKSEIFSLEEDEQWEDLDRALNDVYSLIA